MKTPPPSLKVNEIFYSLQGEGEHTGRAAVFVRLSGCSMDCPFCDTKYAGEEFSPLTPAQIIKKISKFPARTVILTGGEPCEQDIAPLCAALKKSGYSVHLETNGSRDIDVKNIDHITLSPKKRVNKNMLAKAHAIKILVNKNTDITKYLKYKNVFLQPLDNKKENINLCVKLIKKNPLLRLSLQTHKMINIK